MRRQIGFPDPNNSPDSKILIEWVRKLARDLDKKKQARTPREPSAAWSGPVQDLGDLIESTTELRMLASAMFDEVPHKEPYLTDPVGNRQVRDYRHMLDLFGAILDAGVAPEWSATEYGVGLIGFPFNAILDWPMATQSGYAFFLRADVNAKLKAVLDAWRDDVLATDRSLYVITTGPAGWLSDEALLTVAGDANVVPGQPELTFEQLFKCEPARDPVQWSFKSMWQWDDFFIREFRNIDKLRLVAHADDPRWVVSSCESKPFALQTNVKEYDSFWLKGQPYSVTEMLNHRPEAGRFVGGTVYQAFLNATSYHRWNAPVAGDVVWSGVVEGTYFSEPTITGFTNPVAPDQAQGATSAVSWPPSTWVTAASPGTTDKNIPVRSEPAYAYA
ncbi:hypothetical protein DL769_003834 [Monosporascus sp. CRB-8-3]|nr:hypothetical protein DL769_003834 [Monosporascus sp. CRB-8-3]